ncbi:serine/threonine protein kinase, partial [Myxococcus sp. 1LA]
PAPVRRSAPHMSPPPARVAEPARSRRLGQPAPSGVSSRRLPPPEDAAASSAPVSPPSPRRSSALDVEVSQSVSLTPATVNQRPPPRSSLARGFRSEEDDEESLHTDLNVSSLEYTDPRPTLRDDPDDDESTMGYGGGDSGEYTADTRATPPRRKRPVALLLACFVGLLALGVGVLWFIGAAQSAPAKRPQDLSEGALEPQGTVAPDVRPVPGAVPAQKLTNAPPTAQDVARPDAPEPEAPDAPVKTPEAGAPSPEAHSETSPAANAEPSRVSVRFDAPARTVLRREGGERLPINTLVSLPVGPIRVSYQCPGRRKPKGTKPYLIEPASEGPLVLQIPCKKRR